MKITGFKIGWRETAHWCSIKCRDSDPQFKEEWREKIDNIDRKKQFERQRETMREKYGVEHIAKTDYFKTQMKEFHQTADREVMREKYKETCRVRYGVDHYYQSEEFKKAVWGDEYARKALLEKRYETCKERYGTEHYLKSRAFEETMKEKYGGFYPSPSKPELVVKSFIEMLESQLWPVIELPSKAAKRLIFG